MSGNNKKKYTTKKVELMELKLSHHQQKPHFGVITRARALALQPPQPSSTSSTTDHSSSYLQLRSRRLHKRTTTTTKKNRRKDDKTTALGFVVSCGENFVDTQPKSRSTRESTPCSLIRNPDAASTPGSTTKHTASAEADKAQNSSMIMPTTQQMNEFFAETEIEDQRRFIEKYNFDVINDKPLPGRYEWKKLNP